MKKIMVSIMTAAAVLTASFVPLSGSAATPAEELRALGIIEGYDDGMLHEEYSLTRAEAVTMLMRAVDFDDAKWYKSEISKFDDVPLSHWASGYVYKSVERGMSDGVTDTQYRPEENVTYEQAVKLIVCLLGYGDESFVYPDSYLKKAEELGLLDGVDAGSGEQLTRGTFAALLYNATGCRTAEGGSLIPAEEDDSEEYRYYEYAADDGFAMPEMAAEVGVSAAKSAGGGAAASSASGGGSYGRAGHVPYIDDEMPIIIDQQPEPKAGQLTAGRWNDAENYGFWQGLMQDRKYWELQKKWEIPIDLDAVKEDEQDGEDVLDLMFTIDTTGSMGDELNYLKAEIKDVVMRLDTNVRLSCNYYRDTTDRYTVKPFPFTTNVDKVADQISRQYASGGGDYPEAVDLALLDAIEEHDWSESARSRLLFLVLDAPPHFEQEVIANIQTAVNSAVEKGIHIIPIASSGVDKDTEFFLRSLALATGGTYIFLTDDSGIGYSHIEPTIGSYEVEYLNELILKTIKEYIGQDYDYIDRQYQQQTEPAEPTEEPAEPTEEPAEPTEEPAEPTEEPAEPTEEPAEPTEEPAEDINE